MGKLLKRKGKKFRLFSTVSSRFYSPWLTRDETIDWVIYEMKKNLKEQIKDLKRTFPKGYVDYNSHKLILD